MLRKRSQDVDPVESERQALADQRRALEDLRLELAERVAAVHDREAELRAAIAQAGGVPSTGLPLPPLPPADASLERRETELDARARELEAREAALAARASEPDTDTAEQALELERRAAALDRREEELTRRERELAVSPLPDGTVDERRLAQIDARLDELKRAELAFLRTQQELADRSEAVAARERLATQKERELDEREDGWGSAAEIRELESRLRRLETQRTSLEQTQGFTGGFKKLAEEGTRKRSS